MQTGKQRRKSRKICLQVLYSNDAAGINVDDVLNGKIELPNTSQIDDYAKSLIEQTIKYKDDIDKRLVNVSKNWALDRMSIVDRCLLRQSVCEMLHFDDVPISVTINEAVELAKEYGSDDDSHKYINGVLGKIAKDLAED